MILRFFIKKKKNNVRKTHFSNFAICVLFPDLQPVQVTLSKIQDTSNVRLEGPLNPIVVLFKKYSVSCERRQIRRHAKSSQKQLSDIVRFEKYIRGRQFYSQVNFEIRYIDRSNLEKMLLIRPDINSYDFFIYSFR